MTDKLKAAVDRLRKVNEDSVWDYETEQALQCDRAAIADLYLDEHPEDDDEPVTDQWFKEAGAEYFGEALMWSWRIGGLTVMGVLPARLPDGCWSYRTRFDDKYCGSGIVDLPPQKTRGDVRRLCKAIGVELKEGK